MGKRLIMLEIVSACEEPGSGSGANRGSMALIEANSIIGQRVDMWRRVFTSISANGFNSDIVGKNNDDVGLFAGN